MIGIVLFISLSIQSQSYSSKAPSGRTEVQPVSSVRDFAFYEDFFGLAPNASRKRPGYDIPEFQPPTRFPTYESQPDISLTELDELLELTAGDDDFIASIFNRTGQGTGRRFEPAPATVYLSASRQGASQTHPRSFAYSARGGIVASFVAGPHLRGYNELEASLYDQESKKLTYVSLRPNGVRTEENPAECQTCHGITGRMKRLWMPRNLWINTNGSQSFSSNDNDEYEGFKAFVDMQATHPRYKAFSAETYFVTENTTPGWIPNQTLTIAVTERNYEMLAHEVKSHPDFDNYSPAIYAALLDCADLGSFFPEQFEGQDFEEVKAKTMTSIEQEVTAALEIISAQAGLPSIHEMRQQDFNARISGNLRFVLGQMGINTASFAISAAPLSYHLSQVDKVYPMLIPESESHYDTLFAAMGSRAYEKQTECNEVKENSLASLASTQPSEWPESKLTGKQILEAYCESCHNDSAAAPMISFEPGHAEIARLVEERTDPGMKVERRMPQYQIPLPPEYRSTLLEYLR